MLVAEAVALRNGVRTTVALGIQHIVIEGDNRLIIEGLLGISSIPW